VFRNACTVQPKAWPAGGAVTVAGSELIRTPFTSRNAPNGDADSAGAPITGQGVSRNSTWPWAPAIVQAAAAGLRWATSFAHQHLLSDPFAAA
jgi:hypothetical protein